MNEKSSTQKTDLQTTTQVSEKNMGQGGKIISTTLKSVCETGKPTKMARFIMVMGRLLEFTSPKQTLSSNWPMDKRIELDSKFPTEN